MKPYRFENAPLLKAFSERPSSDNELDRHRVNERRNRIETDAVTNETASVLTMPELAAEVLVKLVYLFPFDSEKFRSVCSLLSLSRHGMS